MGRRRRQRTGLLIAGLALQGMLACDDASSTTSGSGGNAGLPPNSTLAGGGNAGFSLDACLACAKPQCPSQASACDGSSACKTLMGCVLKCTSGDLTCQNGCTASASTDPMAMVAAANYAACAAVDCTNVCVPSAAGLGNVGGAGQLGTGSNRSSAGGAPNVNPATGGAVASGGSSSATTAFQPASGYNWLSFEGNWADPGTEPNRTFNISGVAYAYGDGCATLEWDPVSRCATGTLCSPGATYKNWGIAIGFDFHNTGDTATPANAKLTWNPAAVGARGVAWDLSGTAPGLQLWVLQMDPKWGGICTADSCEINGPPFGYGSISTSNVGNIYFTNLDGWLRDDWGGSGTNYTLKTADTVSLQFKLSAKEAGGESFDFCIDRLGIIY